MTRCRDLHQSIYSFYDEFLVRCPHCHSCALIRPIDPNNAQLFAPRRFSCTGCGAAKNWAGKSIGGGGAGELVDPYFHYRLWLQIRCCGQTLWAYNWRHLQSIELFVAAKLRESKPDERYGYSNRSLFSRLPQWMQSRHNRDDILKAIEKRKHLL